MSFDYQNMKTDDLKDFTVLDDTDNLSVEFENGETVDFYNNTAGKRAFNDRFDRVRNGKESNIEDYVQHGLKNDLPSDDKQQKKEKKKQKEIEL